MWLNTPLLHKNGPIHPGQVISSARLREGFELDSNEIGLLQPGEVKALRKRGTEFH